MHGAGSSEECTFFVQSMNLCFLMQSPGIEMSAIPSAVRTLGQGKGHVVSLRVA